MKEIHASGALTAKDLTRAYWLNLKPRPLFKWLGIGMLLLAIATGLVTLGLDDLAWLGVAILALVAVNAYWLFLRPVWSIHRQIRSSPTVTEHYDMIVRDDSISMNSESMTADVQWSLFTGYRMSADLVLLYQSTNIYRPLPRRFFTTEEDWQAFRLLVHRQLGKCHCCGYMLRGTISNDCPECGAAITPEV